MVKIHEINNSYLSNANHKEHFAESRAKTIVGLIPHDLHGDKSIDEIEEFCLKAVEEFLRDNIFKKSVFAGRWSVKGNLPSVGGGVSTGETMFSPMEIDFSKRIKDIASMVDKAASAQHEEMATLIARAVFDLMDILFGTAGVSPIKSVLQSL